LLFLIHEINAFGAQQFQGGRVKSGSDNFKNRLAGSFYGRKGCNGGGIFGRKTNQPQRRPDHKPQGPFGSHDQMNQVVTR
jgi:hypothetical protein